LRPVLPRIAIMLGMAPMAIACAHPVTEPSREQAMLELSGCRIGPEALALVGRAADRETLAALRAATGAATLRVVRPGDPVSADYVSDRLTIDVDRRERIVRISCG
jgi:hypothetical protein